MNADVCLISFDGAIFKGLSKSDLLEQQHCTYVAIEERASSMALTCAKCLSAEKEGHALDLQNVSKVADCADNLRI